MSNSEKALQMHEQWNGKLETTAKAREFDTLKSKNVPQSLEIGLFFVKFLFLIYSNV